MNDSPYGQLVIDQVPRALALMDRDPASATFGCFDRSFWHYRTLTNFPAATWQMLVLPLALLYRSQRPDNPWAGDSSLRTAVEGGLLWWTGIQRKNGSFDEWYRFEQSYCPTAFTVAGVVQAVLEMGEALSPQVRARTTGALLRSGHWLSTRENPTVMNQNCAAALALWGIWRLTGETRWRDAAARKFDLIARAQSQDGWLSEYGGMDFGYSTLALDQLAAADRLEAGEQAKSIALGLCRLLVAAGGAGRGCPGRLGSRGTSHLFPYGAEHFAAKNPDAARLAARWRTAYRDHGQPGPGGYDDRYFAYFAFPAFAMAWLLVSRGTLGTAPEGLGEDSRRTELPDAGYLTVRGRGWSVAIARRKGGALAIERSGQAPLYHLGYEIADRRGRRYSSAHWRQGALEPVEGGAIRAAAVFEAVSDRLPLVRYMVPFQLFTELLRLPTAAALFHRWIKGRVVRPRARLGIELVREIRIEGARLTVRDQIRRLPSARGAEVGDLRLASGEPAHSPSSRLDEARFLVPANWTPDQLRERLNAEGSCQFEFAVDLTALVSAR